jgi:hypothetical protein
VSFPLYMDVHVPYAITRALRQRGVNVLTAQEDGTTEWDDPPLLDRATELGRLLLPATRICWWRPRAGSDGDASSRLSCSHTSCG